MYSTKKIVWVKKSIYLTLHYKFPKPLLFQPIKTTHELILHLSIYQTIESTKTSPRKTVRPN